MCSMSQLPIRIIFCFPFYSLSLYIYNGYGEQCKKIKVLKWKTSTPFSMIDVIPNREKRELIDKKYLLKKILD